jgi:hypothetical protein
VVVGWATLEIVGSVLNLIIGSAPSGTWKGPAEWVNRNARVIAYTQFIGGVVVLACGLAAWRGRKWARRACQVALVASGAVVVSWGLALAIKPPITINPLLNGPIRAALLGACLGWAAPLFVAAWLFGTREVVAWFEGCSNAGQQRVAADEGT